MSVGSAYWRPFHDGPLVSAQGNDIHLLLRYRREVSSETKGPGYTVHVNSRSSPTTIMRPLGDLIFGSAGSGRVEGDRGRGTLVSGTVRLRGEGLASDLTTMLPH